MMTIDNLLDASPTWQRFHTTFTDQNERKVREKVARALVDAGVFAPGTPRRSVNRVYPIYSTALWLMGDKVRAAASKSAKAFLDELERRDGEFRAMPIELMEQRDRVLERYAKKGWESSGTGTKPHAKAFRASGVGFFAGS
jgi:hypothetical protein